MCVYYANYERTWMMSEGSVFRRSVLAVSLSFVIASEEPTVAPNPLIKH